jgi:histidyl-tRNA synthetase
MSDTKIKAIYGTKDILPAEAPLWFKIMTTVARETASCNYAFIHPPIFEATELFSRGIGETTDIVSKEMYTFKDQGDRSLTLRPEGTASVVRAYIEHSMGAREGLVKVWYLGPMFRQERPQAGRLRQFYQFGVEAIGSLDPAIDAEVIGLNFRILSSLGLDGLRVQVNSIGMPEDRKAHRKAFSDFVTPKLGEFCADCQRRFQTNPLRMFDCKERNCQALLKDAPTVLEYLAEDNLTHFDSVKKYLEIAGIPYDVDKRLVRGLDYYTRTAWEIKSDKLGSQDSLCGGGRYDLLVEQLGGNATPAIGFAAGIERIMLAMGGPVEDDSKRPGVFIVAMGDKAKEEAFKLAVSIRKHGLAADIDYLGRSMKSQMKQADKSRFAKALIIGENELAKGIVIVRNMIDSAQTEIGLEKIYNARSADELGEIIG